MVARGWAVVGEGGIYVATVSPTRIAAIINWLVIERDQMIIKWTPDEQIEMLWKGSRTDERVIEVTVEAEE